MGCSFVPRVRIHQIKIAVSPMNTPSPSHLLITEAITISAK